MVINGVSAHRVSPAHSSNPVTTAHRAYHAHHARLFRRRYVLHILGLRRCSDNTKAFSGQRLFSTSPTSSPSHIHSARSGRNRNAPAMPSDALPPINYDDYLSSEARGRVRSSLKDLRPFFDLPGMISVGVSPSGLSHVHRPPCPALHPLLNEWRGLTCGHRGSSGHMKRPRRGQTRPSFPSLGDHTRYQRH
jgi:hypothetical protein